MATPRTEALPPVRFGGRLADGAIGIGGGIMGVVPGRCSVGVLGPALDEHGNSLAGIMLLHDLSELFDWSIY